MLKSNFNNLEEYYKLECGRYLLFLDHSLSRYMERAHVSPNMKKDVIKVANELALRIIYQANDEPGYYGVHSNSTGIGFVIDWRHDKYDPIDDNNHAFMITFFPVRKYHHFDNKDTVYIVEKLLASYVKDQKRGAKPYFLNANNSVKRFLAEKVLHNRKEYKAQYLLERSQTASQSLKIVFWQGKLYDSNIREFFLLG
jgi:hypothetical protein